MQNADLVDEVLDCVKRRTNINSLLLRDIERDVRRNWGGGRHYVASRGSEYRRHIVERDECIRSDYARLTAAGTPKCEACDYLGRRYDLSAMRIKQILRDASPDMLR